tara:strand:- start:569 stop:1888 length:1320 start_codon:yes stop_codon:yes gene_type:complete
MSEEKNYEVVIIGGGLSGLVAAYSCQRYGFTPLILERSSEFGGGNKSTYYNNGLTFDSGYHTLDYNRSKLATNFFKSVLEGEYRKFVLKRGIVLKNHLIPYNSPLEEWPEVLKSLFTSFNGRDNIDRLVAVSQIEETYGKGYADLIVNDVLSSYPSIKWSIDNGADVLNHLGTVYPWFFPKAEKKARETNEWEKFHDQMRNVEHTVMYPKEKGFGNFPLSIFRQIEKFPYHAELNCKDLTLNFSNDAIVESITTKGETYRAPCILWCAPIPTFFRAIGKKVKINGTLQEIILGDFQFEKPMNHDYHEILIGSSNIPINRASFPGHIQGGENNLVQVEIYLPKEDSTQDQASWKEKWLESLYGAGVVGKDNDPTFFGFNKCIRGYATVDSFENISNTLKRELKQTKTNIKFPFPMVGPENINRLVPEVITNVTSELKNIN